MVTLMAACLTTLAGDGVDPKERWQPKKGDTVYTLVTFVGRGPSGASQLLLPCAPLEFRRERIDSQPPKHDSKTGGAIPLEPDRVWMVRDASGWDLEIKGGWTARMFRTETECREHEKHRSQSDPNGAPDPNS